MQIGDRAYSFLVEAIIHGDVDEVEEQLGLGTNPIQDDFFRTWQDSPVIIAIRENQPACFEALITQRHYHLFGDDFDNDAAFLAAIHVAFVFAATEPDIPNRKAFLRAIHNTGRLDLNYNVAPMFLLVLAEVPLHAIIDEQGVNEALTYMTENPDDDDELDVGDETGPPRPGSGI